MAITKKCIEALERFSTLEHHIYVYDNLTTHKLWEHADYFARLLESKVISQVTFNSADSTFNAFSKIVSCNQFGRSHEEDPRKDEYKYLMIMDNDIIVKPGWDIIFKEAWSYVNKSPLLRKHIKIISQLPGGFLQCKRYSRKIASYEAYTCIGGASSFWSIRSNFFRDVGFLDIKESIGQSKFHDFKYREILDRNNKDAKIGYGLALDAPMAFHVGGIYGSICDMLHIGNGDRIKGAEFKEDERVVSSLTLDDLIDKYANNSLCINW